MTKLYYIKTNAYDMLIADDGEIRWVLTDDKYPEMYDSEPSKVLASVEDWSSWEQYEESVEELTVGCDVLAELEGE